MSTNKKIMFEIGFFVLCFVLFSANAEVMKQDDPCDDLNRTWVLKTSEKMEISTYFRSKLFHTEILLETSHIPNLLPFHYVKVEPRDPQYSMISVELHDFMEALIDVYPSTPNKCILTFKRGFILESVKNINQVHVINMNHLDVGFNTNQFYSGSRQKIPGYINNVLNWYFQIYFPRAVKLGNDLRRIQANESFIYITHPWLVNLYLDCPNIKLSGVQLECPSEEELTEFRRAVWMGDINWHAGPLNQEPEASNPELFSYSLTLSQKLDEYFSLNKTARTLSQRDIPGMTQAAIPYLVRNGIAAVSVGVNQGSAPPDVPSPNVWRYGNDSVITYWHKGGYPNDPGKDPLNPGGLSRHDCQMLEASDHALCFAFRSDNLGPPIDINEIKTDFEILRFQFPGARIKASTFDEFTEHIIPLKNTLPVLTKEIGDTWIQGPASDPLKMSHYRTINRLRSQCLRDGECDLNDKRLQDMSRLLLKLPEHTYGLSSAFDYKNWANEDFQPRQYIDEGFLNATMAWLSNREFNSLALNALKNHPLASKIIKELKKLKPYIPNLDGHEVHNVNEDILCDNGMKMRIGKTGALTRFTDVNGVDWADEEHTLAEIKYRTFNDTDFEENFRYYAYRSRVAMRKPGMAYTRAESKFWPVESHGIYIPKTGDPCQSVYVRVLHTDIETWFKYGAPVSYFIQYQLQHTDLHIEYQFFNKPSTRLPESLMLNFTPKPFTSHSFYLHKLGYLIDPMNIVNNGSQYVHGIDEGVWFVDKDNKGIVIESLDIGTVLVQNPERSPNPLPGPMFPMTSKPTGMAFNIFNNIWDVNFIFWYPFQPQDKQFKARFKIRFRK